MSGQFPEVGCPSRTNSRGSHLLHEKYRDGRRTPLSLRKSSENAKDPEPLATASFLWDDSSDNSSVVSNPPQNAGNPISSREKHLLDSTASDAYTTPDLAWLVSKFEMLNEGIDIDAQSERPTNLSRSGSRACSVRHSNGASRHAPTSSPVPGKEDRTSPARDGALPRSLTAASKPSLTPADPFQNSSGLIDKESSLGDFENHIVASLSGQSVGNYDAIFRNSRASGVEGSSPCRRSSVNRAASKGRTPGRLIASMMRVFEEPTG